MLIITICVGSSCNIRGSDELAMTLHRCIEKEQLDGMVDIIGAFCMDNCSKGVSIQVGDRQFSGIRPEDGETFFYREIIGYVDNKLRKDSAGGGA
ncbi:MAG: hypothetical protein C0394_00925 [Syntrophus sp. (in: bacteria)]|nr:hypothetical protein [Syntrophus sp. (in: bacteria)]